MYLAEVRIRNFRNLLDVNLRFSAGLNVIVGENNVGKTNVLDAIRVALGPAALAGQAPRLSVDDLHILPDGKRTSEPIRIDLVFRGLSLDEQAEFLDCLEYDASAPEKSAASIHYEWAWSERRKRWSHRRWGGSTTSDAAVPEDNLQSIKIILLDALRDAVRALAPGRESRLGRLLSTVAGDADRARIAGVFSEANQKLQDDEELIKRVENRISGALQEASRGLSQTAFVRASEADFDRIVAGLRLLVRLAGSNATPILGELRSNGLGYNNLLFIGTVLAELGAARDATLPILLVEEPEAHLHPQLQILLADFLAKGASVDGAEPTQAGDAPHAGDAEVPQEDGDDASQAVEPDASQEDEIDAPQRVQTILTTHSPTIAAHVPPDVIRVLHRDREGAPCCVNVSDCGLSVGEMNRLRRMLDITKATLLFSRGVVLVEGISEQILFPVLAAMGSADLSSHGVSIVSIAGVSFATIAKLFGPDRLRLPVAIVTDADPEILYPEPDKPNWKDAEPARGKDGAFIPGSRLTKLLAEFKGNGVVAVFASDVTLEYDLAAASSENARRIYDTWASLYDRGPRTLTQDGFAACGSVEAKALELWRAICVTKPQHGKGELAQALADALESRQSANSTDPVEFVVPGYIRRAIRHVTGGTNADGPEPGAA